ncbi:MAG TPA: hypothetical protein VFC51_16620 [Chloroflexota bacterium]|nr:hypothetical protein [Chloroflexota bacterium]
MPYCNPGETFRPSAWPGISGCIIHGVPMPRPGTSRAAATSIPPHVALGPRLAFADDQGALSPTAPRHECCQRASIATGDAFIDAADELPTSDVGTNYGAFLSLLTPPGPPTRVTLCAQLINDCGALGSLFNNMPTAFPGGNGAEVGWVYPDATQEHGSYGFCEQGELYFFTDNGDGNFLCVNLVTLSWNSWYNVTDLNVGGGAWIQYAEWPTGSGTWFAIGRIDGLQDQSTGLDPGIEFRENRYIGSFYSGFANLYQMRTQNGPLEIVGPRDFGHDCHAQPTGNQCAYTVNNSTLYAYLDCSWCARHSAFLAGR